MVQAKSLLANARREIQIARETLAKARAEIESSSLIIQGVLRRFPELAEAGEEDELASIADDTDLAEDLDQPPSGAAAVLSILQVHEERDYTVIDMVAALKRNGWLPKSANPPNAVRSALERLVATENSGVIKHVSVKGTVAYRYSSP